MAFAPGVADVGLDFDRFSNRMRLRVGGFGFASGGAAKRTDGGQTFIAAKIRRCTFDTASGW
jgi:hypothetical protein